MRNLNLQQTILSCILIILYDIYQMQPIGIKAKLDTLIYNYPSLSVSDCFTLLSMILYLPPCLKHYCNQPTPVFCNSIPNESISDILILYHGYSLFNLLLIFVIKNIRTLLPTKIALPTIVASGYQLANVVDVYDS